MKKHLLFKRGTSLVLVMALTLSLPALLEHQFVNKNKNYNLLADEKSEDKNSSEDKSQEKKSIDDNKSSKDEAVKTNTAKDSSEDSKGESDKPADTSQGTSNDNENGGETVSAELETPENDDAVITKSESLGKLTEEEAGKDFEKFAENDAAVLFYNSEASLVRLYNKKKQLVFDTKVLDGKKGNRLTKNLQKSDFQLTFLKELRTLGVQSENNNEMSIELKQFEYQKIDNGLKVVFTLGKQGLSADDLPIAISSDKMQKILKKLNKKQRKQLQRVYREFKDRYARQDKQTLSALQVKLYHGLLYDKGGYTQEDLEEDNAKFASADEKKSSQLKLELTMEYVLDGEDLLVRVPLSEIKINPEDYLPYRLRLLPYAMVGSEVDDGYFVIPDGDGALVRFNNDRKESANYSKRMYGNDPLFDKEEKRRSTVLKHPVFGMKRDKQGVLLILEDGKDLADVSVEISGKSDEFNKLGIDYRLIDVDQVKTVGSSSVTQNKYPEKLYKGDLVQRYRILDEKEADWLEMARVYATYLENKGLLPAESEDTNSKVEDVSLSFFGIVPKKKFMLGIPYMSSQTLTTYTEATDILRDLYSSLSEQNGDAQQSSKDNLFRVNYIADTDGGLFPNKKNDFAISKKLGTESQREELSQLVEENGGVLARTMVLNEVSGLRGFKKADEISRSLSGEYAREAIYNSVHQASHPSHESPWYISPRYLSDYIKLAEELIAKEKEINILGIGQRAIPDYKRGDTVLRHEAMQIEHDILLELAKNEAITISDPADYALNPDISISGLASEADPYRTFDYNIPFISSVYRNRFSYRLASYEPNSFMSLKRYLLHALEMGASPEFLLTAEDALSLENGDFEGLLGSEYKLRKADIILAMQTRKDYRGHIGSASLLSNEIFGDGSLRALTFDNGTTMWLNYSESELPLADVKIDSESYLFTVGNDSEKLHKAAEDINRKQQAEEEEQSKAEEEAKKQGELSKEDGDKIAENDDKVEEKSADKKDKKVKSSEHESDETESTVSSAEANAEKVTSNSEEEKGVAEK